MATTTAITNFADSVVPLIRASAIALLRTGLPYVPREATVFGEIVKGAGDGTGKELHRYFVVNDIDPGAGTVVEGVTPSSIDLTLDYDEWTAEQKAVLVRVSDLFASQSPENIIEKMVERTNRAFAVLVNKAAKAIWAAGVPGEIATGGAGSPAQLAAFLEAAALLSDAGVPRIGGTVDEMRGQVGGNYVAIISPFTAYDLKTSAEPGDFLDVSRYTNPSAILVGEIGQLGGVRFIEASGAETSAGGVARSYVMGAEALAWSSPASISAHFVGFEDSDSDPLAQRAAAGVKGFMGGALLTAGGGPRYAVVESLSTIQPGVGS